jgi:hypothetical protein
MCNESQLDALFILGLFRQSISTCFGHICSPPTGGMLYIQHLVRVVLERGILKLLERIYISL